MRIAVTGAAGMLGRKLVERLAEQVLLGAEVVSHLLLVDAIPGAAVEAGGIPVDTLVADIAEHGVAWEVVSGSPDVVFHLAAVVSGEAEADFEKGYRVNVDATRL